MMYPYTLSRLTNGPSGAVIGTSTSTGAPSESRVSITYTNASALSVLANPREAAFSASET